MSLRIIFILVVIIFTILISDHANADIPNWGFKMIETEKADEISLYFVKRKSPVVVAVIDTGIDVSHPSLRDHLWINLGEVGKDSLGRNKSTNQIDDDGNGFVDDIHGWNFVEASPHPFDRHGHGTHVTGIISKIAPQAQIMVLKYFDPKASESTGISHTINAIEYAIQMKADIINYSAGGPSPNEREKRALQRARALGILVVAAAGNESQNSDFHRYYPADYGFSNILSVTALDSQRRILPSSNFGEVTVHMAAPGLDINSTLPGGGFGKMTGTSQATAFASGVAALLLGTSEKKLSPPEVIAHLKNTGELNTSLVGKTSARTQLNAFRALVIRHQNSDAAGNYAINTTGVDPKLFFNRQSDVNFDGIINSNPQILDP